MPLLSCRRKARPLVREDRIVSESEALRRIPVRSAAQPLAWEIQIRAVNRVAERQRLPAPALRPNPYRTRLNPASNLQREEMHSRIMPISRADLRCARGLSVQTSA